MRLLVISSAYPPFSSPESAHTKYLCERIAERGHEVHLVTSKIAATDDKEVESFKIHRSVDRWNWRGLPTLLQCVSEVGPEAILLLYIDWIYDVHPMITCLSGILRMFGYRGRFVTMMENESGLSGRVPSQRGLLGKVLESAIMQILHVRKPWQQGYGPLLRDSDAIIALSAHHLAAFERIHPGVRAKTIVVPVSSLVGGNRQPECVTRDLGRARLEIEKDTFVLVYFGYIYPSKGIETLIRAYAEVLVVSGTERLHLVIIGGPGDERYFDAVQLLSEQLCPKGSVSWLGHCSEEDVSLHLHGADVCVLPFSAGVRLNNSSFAAAISHGVPVLTTRGEDFVETEFKDGENLVLFPAGDWKTLAKKIGELMADSTLRRTVAIGARNLSDSIFSPAKTIDSIVDTIVLC